jgi:hypothetical protein
MRKALVTMYFGAHQEFRSFTSAPMRRFAERHGYELVEVTPGVSEPSPEWRKFAAMRGALEDHDVATWVDGDVYFVDHREDPAASLSNGAFLSVLHDVRYGACSAVFSMRRSRIALRFLEDAWAQRFAGYCDQGAINVLRQDSRYASGVVWLDSSWHSEGAGERILHCCRESGPSVRARLAAGRRTLRERLIVLDAR